MFLAVMLKCCLVQEIFNCLMAASISLKMGSGSRSECFRSRQGVYCGFSVVATSNKDLPYLLHLTRISSVSSIDVPLLSLKHWFSGWNLVVVVFYLLKYFFGFSVIVVFRDV